MSNVTFSAAAIRATAISNLADSRIELDGLYVASIIREELDGTEPEVIYTADAFEVCQDDNLIGHLCNDDIDERVGDFSGCKNANQCVEREANAIVSLYYEMAASGLADEVVELIGLMKDNIGCEGEFSVSGSWSGVDIVESGVLNDGITRYEMGTHDGKAYGRIMYPTTKGTLLDNGDYDCEFVTLSAKIEEF